MAKFRYRMQSILDIKYQLETQAKMELGKAQIALNEEQEKQQRLIDRKAAYLEEGRRLREDTISVNDLRDNRNAVLIMDDLIVAQRIEVAKAAEAVEEKRAEAKVVDELTSYTYGQRGKENGNGDGSDEYGHAVPD